MSVGNSNTDGNKKNNFPWQIAMLRILGSISNAVGGTAGDGAGNVAYGPILSTGAGMIPANTKAISISNSGNASASINGGTGNLPAGAVVEWSGYFPATMAYNGSGTTLVITYVI